MKRITEIDLGGKTYPLNFSLKAAKKIAERYGDISNVLDAFKGKSTSEMAEEALWLMHTLIEQGIAYKNLTEDTNLTPPSMEDLEILIGIFDLKDLKPMILDAMTAGADRDIEVEPDPNEKTTQDS